MRNFFAVFSILALGFFTVFCGQEAFAAQPVTGTLDVSGANKWHAISNTLTHVSPGVRVPLFGAQPLDIRTSETGDLVIEVHAECAVVMSDFDPNVDSDAALMVVRVWVEVDGVPVEVGSRDPSRGRVNFCDWDHRQFKLVVGGGLDVEQQFDHFSHAAGFKWFKINVGHGVHTVQAFADLIAAPVFIQGSVAAIIGKRSMAVLTTTTLQN